MDTVTGSLGSMMKNSDPYSASGGFNENGQLVTTGLTGDHSAAEFSEDANDAMGKNEFLLLLTEQLKYQDPLNPMDNTKFVEQLATFSQLEAFTSVKESVEGMKTSYDDALSVQNMAATSQTNASAVSLVGKEVRLMQNTITLDGSGRLIGSKVNMGNRQSVDVEIFDENGETVQMIKVTRGEGDQFGEFSWDGKNQDGTMADIGKYGMQVVGQDQDPSLYCFVEDTVDGLRYTSEGPVLRVGGEEISVANIIEVNYGTSNSSGKSEGFESLSISQALGLVGMEVTLQDSETTYKPEQGAMKQFTVDMGAGGNGYVTVKNLDGQVVYRKEVSGFGTQTVDVAFNDYDGSGWYSVGIEGLDGAMFVQKTTIDSVSSKDGIIKMKAGGKEITPSQILEINAAATKTVQV